MTRSRTLLSALVLGAMLASTARADDPTTEAKQRMREGRALAEKGRNEEARIKFAEACAIAHTFNCIRSLATVEFLSGHFVEAYDHLTETLADPSAAALDAAARGDLEGGQKSAFLKTGHIAVTARPGATIAIDGRVVGAAPLPSATTVVPGTHTVEVTSTDGTVRSDVNAAAGQTTQVAPGPPPPSIPAPPATTMAPGPSAAPIASQAPAAPSVHGDAPMEPPRAPFWTTRRTWGLVAAGAGAVALGAGFAFAAAANHDADQADSLHNQVSGSGPAGCTMATASACGALQSAKDGSDRDRALDIGFVSAGLVGIAAGALLLLLPDSSASASTGVTPTVGPHGAALELRRSF